MPPSVNTSQVEADTKRDISSIGKNRLSILLCAWIACIFMFALVATHMFYGADTTGDLSNANGELRTPPAIHPEDRVADRQSGSGQLRNVSHSVFPTRASHAPGGYADAIYGQVPSAPSKSRPNADSRSANQQRTRQRSTPSYSIIPKHALERKRSNKTQQPDQTPIMIRPANRTLAGPSWSVLPGTAQQPNTASKISVFSQLPAHRSQKESSSEPNSAATNKDAAKPPATEDKSANKIPRAAPLITPPPIPRTSNRSAHPVSPADNQTQTSQRRPNRTQAFAISSTSQPRDILQIPSGPIEDLPASQVFEQPVQMSLQPHVSEIQRLYDQQPVVNSGWSDFANASALHNTAWWESNLAAPLYPDRLPINLTLAACLSIAQTNSPELQVLHSDWYIQQAESDRLAAAFDWSTFVEAIWNRDSTPVGSDLDGATDRLRSRSGNSSFGIRRQTETGAELEISQQFGTRSGNSIFLNPNPQATSRLQFDYQKPLLRGFGEDFNTSPQKLALIARDTAYDRFRIGVQDYLLNVASAYWSVVLQRGIYLQAQASLDRVQQISKEMAARIEVDVTPGMLDRSLSEVAIRKANLIQARYDVLRAQSALLRLIYGAEFNQFANHEVITATLPLKPTIKVQPEDRVQAALQQRSEVHQAIREIKAATIRYDLAANEVLPALNLVLSGYVAGLDGGDDIGTAWTNQFSQGEPGVGIGFDFEVPYRNRAAEAAAERQQISIKRVQAALQTVIADVGEDVRNQVIERNKFGDMLDDQQEAIVRVRSLLKNATIRREELADGNQVADLYLENLLQIQNRLESTESAYLQSQVQFSLADNALLRALAEIDSLAGHVDSNTLVAPTFYPAAGPAHTVLDHTVPAHTVPAQIVPAQIVIPSTTGHSFGQ